MLTPGNRKLGGRRIRGFGLPSGTSEVCSGLSAVCQAHCYAAAYERYRPAAAAAYRRNLTRSRRRDFVLRMRTFLIAHAVRVVRVHIGSDFYSPAYARKWLQIVSRSPRVRFYFYTRAWRVPTIRTVIEELAARRRFDAGCRPGPLGNFRILLSADLNREPPRGAAHPLRRG
jgi:hypothetical protein